MQPFGSTTKTTGGKGGNQDASLAQEVDVAQMNRLQRSPLWRAKAVSNQFALAEDRATSGTVASASATVDGKLGPLGRSDFLFLLRR